MENLVAIELAYINTKHPDFHKDAALVSSLVKSAEINQTKQNKRHLPSSTVTTNAIIPVENVRYFLFFDTPCIKVALLRTLTFESTAEIALYARSVKK